MDSLCVDCLREMYKTLAKAAKLFEPSDYPCAEKLATILRDYFWEKAGEHIDSAGEEATLFSYQSDSTSFLTRSVVRGRISGQAQKRVGMCSSEMLLERGLLLSREAVFWSTSRASCGMCSRPRAGSSGQCARVAQEHLHPTLRV